MCKSICETLPKLPCVIASICSNISSCIEQRLLLFRSIWFCFFDLHLSICLNWYHWTHGCIHFESWFWKQWEFIDSRRKFEKIYCVNNSMEQIYLLEYLTLTRIRISIYLTINANLVQKTRNLFSHIVYMRFLFYWEMATANWHTFSLFTSCFNVEIIIVLLSLPRNCKIWLVFWKSIC